MISLSTLVAFVVYLLVVGLVLGLLVWLIDYVAGNFPVIAPFAKVAKVIVVVVGVLILIGLLLNLTPYPLVRL
jgi:hypothetical protein